MRIFSRKPAMTDQNQQKGSTPDSPPAGNAPPAQLPQSPPDPGEANKDLQRGRDLLITFAVILLLLSALYVCAHLKYPLGLFAPKAIPLALNIIQDASIALEAAPQDALEKDVVSSLSGADDQLGLLAPRLGLSSDYTSILSQISGELAGAVAHKAVLIPLFNKLRNRVEAGSGSIFWSGSQDRWIEMVYWTVAGTLVFLLCEIKAHYVLPYGQNQQENQDQYRNFIGYTPWYVVNLFRGPFIAVVILLALSSISFEAIGVSLDVNSAPITVWVVLAAILGYYARLANEQLELVAGYLFKSAWENLKKGKGAGSQEKT